ncbi:hypothetical protein SmJEL517_g01407 [Synchytrium microbalum]|uniref:CobW C-terminal domain-containing protein n=1 Tax=Synchytrium microbalum TaxID=1806994 RepID=A0A507CE09_9FUNG|nr:uncharacterized protein SmJEL517_g01407 [Synchytrium microbalum]TPX36276.1 hypothetical protein SmJEL517_g01407 [Synchytrium microbalum]
MIKVTTMDEEDEAPELIPDDEEAPAVSDIAQIQPLLPSTSLQERVPVTIITGFLGSGKTTLVQNILTSPHHKKRIAVILNEFGDSAGIEKTNNTTTLSSNDASQQPLPQWVELANGCLCCSTKDTGIQAIESLMESRGRFDYILLESTGLADPAPIASIFWLDEGLASSVKLDGIVTVVDAKHVLKYLEEESGVHGHGVNEATRQIALADRILVNKVDLVDDAGVKEVEGVVRGINAVAPVARCVKSIVDLDFILGLNAFDGRQAPQEVHEDTTIHHHEHDHDHTSHVTTISFTHSTPIHRTCFESWLQRILWEPAAIENLPGLEILRLKAVLDLVESPNTRTIVQAVRELYDLNDGGVWEEGIDKRVCRVVIIGKGLKKEVLYQSFVDAVT